jgi:FG-GAP repeat
MDYWRHTTVLTGAPVKNCQFNCGTPAARGVGGAYVFAFSGSSWSQQAELASSDGGGAFGCSVAVSGTTAIVVENYNESSLMGAAFAFVRSGSNWTQQAKLAASDLVVGDGLIAAAVNGSFAVFGVPEKNSAQGAVYAFVQVGTTWTQNGKLTASDTTSADNFGTAVAINGNTALIGSPFKASQQGAVYVFVRSDSDGTWSQRAKLTLAFPTDGANFGQSVSLSGDTAVIGATNAAYVFIRSGTSWTQQAKLVASDQPVSFGSAVAVDGGTAVVTDTGQNSSQGAAYVFVSSGATWAQQAKLTASDPATNDELGRSTSVSGDTVIVGAAAKNSFEGAAYVFSRSGTTWTQQAKLTASDGVSPDNFGAGVSVSGDLAIVGAYLKNGGIGAAYIFVSSGGNWTQQAELTAIDPAARAIFGIAVSIDGGLAVVGAYKANGGLGEGYVFAQSGTNWTLSMQLKAANGVTGDEFGLQVSLSEGTVIVGAPAHAAGEGAVYVFPFPTLPPVVS